MSCQRVCLWSSAGPWRLTVEHYVGADQVGRQGSSPALLWHRQQQQGRSISPCNDGDVDDPEGAAVTAQAMMVMMTAVAVNGAGGADRISQSQPIAWVEGGGPTASATSSLLLSPSVIRNPRQQTQVSPLAALAGGPPPRPFPSV